MNSVSLFVPICKEQENGSYSARALKSCCMLSSGQFPGAWILNADVSEHFVPS